jgi:hypothetical protein
MRRFTTRDDTRLIQESDGTFQVLNYPIRLASPLLRTLGFTAPSSGYPINGLPPFAALSANGELASLQS